MGYLSFVREVVAHARGFYSVLLPTWGFYQQLSVSPGTVHSGMETYWAVVSLDPLSDEFKSRLCYLISIALS